MADGTSQPLPLTGEVLRAYLGGAGLGTWLLHRLGPQGIDPLGPQAPLTGMLTETLASSQFAIAGKLTGHDARAAGSGDDG